MEFTYFSPEIECSRKPLESMILHPEPTNLDGNKTSNAMIQSIYKLALEKNNPIPFEYKEKW